MKDHAVITQQNQITLPREMLRSLGLKPDDVVSVTLHGTQIIVESAKWTLENVAGSLPGLGNETSDFEEMIREAKEERADQIVKKLQAT